VRNNGWKSSISNLEESRRAEASRYFAISHPEAHRGRIPAMLFAPVCRHSFCSRLGLLLVASSWLIAGGPAIAGAQDIPRKQAPSPRAIILPQTVVAGAQATLAVIDGAGRLMPGIAVEISGGQTGAGSAWSLPEKRAGSAGSPPEEVTTDSTGRALFIAPSNPGPLIARISGYRITASSTGVADKEMATPAGFAVDAPALKVTSYPHVLAILDRFAIAGQGFRGVADSNHVFLGDQPCLVVAASPVSLVVLPGPHIPIGAITLRVRADGRDAGPVPVTGVLLDFSGPAEVPTAGAEGKLILRVHGTTEPLAVEVRNASPEIIQLLHGNLQRLGTSGGEQNIAPVELKFLASGNYEVTARLVPTDSASPHGGN
jgi:hypothetical protein